MLRALSKHTNVPQAYEAQQLFRIPINTVNKTGKRWNYNFSNLREYFLKCSFKNKNEKQVVKPLKAEDLCLQSGTIVFLNT